jgi:hypothetical protein
MKIQALKSNFLLINVLVAISALSPLALVAQADAVNQMLAHSQARQTDYARPANTRLNEIPVQAYRHFARNFSHAEETSWSKVAGGFLVRFQSSGTLNQASYDRYGNFLHGIRYLAPTQIDAHLLKRMKREFPGFEPDIVSEINNDTRTVYIITLKSAHSMKSVLYKEGSFQVIDDLEYAGL